MMREELLHEIDVCKRAYQAEINKNDGHDGSTLSYGLKMRLEAFTDLLEKYYS